MAVFVRPARRVLAPDYLATRATAFIEGAGLDPPLSDFIGQDAVHDTRVWLAFMAGSEWEREYRGRRYSDELTSV